MRPSDLASTRPADAGQSRARLVLADDDRVAREMLAAILQRAGYSVEAVGDGQEAIDRVAQGGVDLVLLDIVMPRLSGLEACRILKGMTGDAFVPVVLVTVKTDTASRIEGLKIGADDYICKPFDEEELLARIEAMLRIKALHDQVAAQRKKLERMSVVDELTGLYNFRYLHTRLSEEWRRAERYHDPFACVLVDIDQLRSVNDAHGRATGDAVVRACAEGIRSCVRDVDVVARYGGEEFLVILPSTHFAGSVSVAERIWRDVTGRTFESGRGAFRVGLSVGIALYPSPDIRTKDAVIKSADAALVHAKREGGNRICVYQQQGYIYAPTGEGRSGS